MTKTNYTHTCIYINITLIFYLFFVFFLYITQKSEYVAIHSLCTSLLYTNGVYVLYIYKKNFFFFLVLGLQITKKKTNIFI